jgi:hypothetical protein
MACHGGCATRRDCRCRRAPGCCCWPLLLLLPACLGSWAVGRAGVGNGSRRRHGVGVCTFAAVSTGAGGGLAAVVSGGFWWNGDGVLPQTSRRTACPATGRRVGGGVVTAVLPYPVHCLVPVSGFCLGLACCCFSWAICWPRATWARGFSVPGRSAMQPPGPRMSRTAALKPE